MPNDSVPLSNNSFPLSTPQRRIWYSEAEQPGTDLNNLALRRRMPAGASFADIEAAWNRLLEHHDSLRLRLVMEAAHNPLLSRLNEGIDLLVERNNALMHPYNLMEKGWIEHITDQHRGIIEAIEGRRHKEAGAILREHLLDAVNLLLDRHPELKTNLQNPYWEL